ncbi:hypothetical protein VTN96DRAFT_1980 [Rasamsonia emersonii]|uniref:Uncharacterized protein n=1 Tax=Rasamsonia emersonii (strain ATCC 16479 / CBS 393.64 / IMI 116815) TaxID=1408163 RepID=A0A0F4Z338_RASE3|nr:hypothetical protein T310_1037 [Rasamsonia emersonii CBS 393.64]KKA24922.1 hypothetical protein T310_1037 [Rasamsonia emersonii CBS 393.64]
MLLPRRTLPLLGLATFGFFLLLTWRSITQGERWRNIPQAVGMGEVVDGKSSHRQDSAKAMPSFTVNMSVQEDRPTKYPYGPRPQFVPGKPKPPGSTYSKMIVCPRTQSESTDWIAEELPDWEAAVYVVDDPTAPLHPPKNKGHEVMVYLTFIIDNYDNLPDIVVFMHSHRYAWHNEEILDFDAAEMLRRLSPERVYREGFMNMRCIWAPGCPDWMHPGALEEDVNKQEETMLARSWGEIFPELPIPKVLAQPCCAQFAVSRDRILAIPKSRYIFYRDWLLHTELSDYISGRVWEYLWHVIFTGQDVYCPKEHVCFCDGFGLCFGGEEELSYFFGTRFQLRDLEEELKQWQENSRKIEEAKMLGKLDELSDVTIPEVGKDAILVSQIEEKYAILGRLKAEAIERGMDPRNRAKEAGRPWKEGDGF